MASVAARNALSIQLDELRSEVEFASAVLLPYEDVRAIRMEIERHMDVLRDVVDWDVVARNRYESLSDCLDQLLVREETKYEPDDNCVAENLEQGMEAEATYRSLYAVLEAVRFRMGDALAIVDLALLRQDMPGAPARTREYAGNFLLTHGFDAELFQDLSGIHAAVSGRLRHIREIVSRASDA